ncbi:hypothetical protein CsSME_00003892 [Camellia sinensis var. sinensis]
MNWVQRKIYLYNVTFGLYMVQSATLVYRSLADIYNGKLYRSIGSFGDCELLTIIDTLVVVLMWFVCYNGFRNASEFCKR